MTSSKNKVLEFKVGDWIDIKIVGIRDSEDPPYKIESIDGDVYGPKSLCYKQSVLHDLNKYKNRAKLIFK